MIPIRSWLPWPKALSFGGRTARRLLKIGKMDVNVHYGEGAATELLRKFPASPRVMAADVVVIAVALELGIVGVLALLFLARWMG
jgi:hypothetical protein